jgi:hypothetical protein
MRHQMMHSDLFSGIFSVVRKVICNGVVELEFALLNQLHDDHRAELLADGGESELRICRVWDIPFPICEPKAFAENDFPLVSDQNGAGKEPVIGSRLTQFFQSSDFVGSYFSVALGQGSVLFLG